MSRCASYVVGEKTYYLTTIYWQNDLTGRAWNESGIRDLEVDKKTNFTLIQHDIWPLEQGHREMVRYLKLGLTPEEIKHYEPWAAKSRSRTPMRLLKALGPDEGEGE